MNRSLSILFATILFLLFLSIQHLYHAVLRKQSRTCQLVSCCSCTFSEPSATVERILPTSGNLSRLRRDEADLNKVVNPVRPQKKIVFKENEAFGIGNVYRSLASVYLLSLVTQRQFLVDSSTYFLFFKPNVTDIYPVDDKTYSISESMIWYDHTIGDYYLNKDFTGKNLNELWKEEVVVFNSITDMSHLILDNKEHMNVMFKLGIAKSTSDYNTQHYELLHYAYQVLFVNTDAFMTVLDGWRPRFRGHRIGVQFRTGGQLANTREDAGYLDFGDIPLCVETVRRYCKEKQYSMDSVTIHVSTDSDEVLRILQREFAGSLFIPPFHSVSHTSFVQSRKRFEGYYSALIDIALLRECEYLVLTWWSSFGWASGMQMKEWNGVYLSHGQRAVKKPKHLIM